MRDGTVAEAAATFLRHIAAVRRLSPLTVESYRRDLAWLCETLGEVAPAAIATRDLQKVLAGRRVGAATVARTISAWRTFFEFVVEAEAGAVNPARALAPPRRERRLPKALTVDEMDRLLGTPGAAGGAEAGALEVRDAAMMELFYASGVRLSELVALDVNDVDLGEGVVYVRRGKGGRGRVAPMGGAARAALEAWLPRRRQWVTGEAGAEGGAEAALFVGAGGRRLGARAVRKRVDLYAARVGFERPVSPHVFRHSCASHFLQSSGDIRATQELLGHQNLSTTQIYTRLDYQHLAKVYDAAHPRAGEKKAKK